MNLRLRRTIAAPTSDVWRALTDPGLVTTWAGVTAARLSAHYPTAGDHALWWDNGTLLHDKILAVEPERLLTSRLQRGPHLVLEEYRLRPLGPRTTLLHADWRGHAALVAGSAHALDGMVRVLRTGVRRRRGTNGG